MADPFAAVPGAVVDESGLQHLGSPLAEQRALADGTAVAPLGDRAVISVSGEDRLTWLDSLTSQSVGRLMPGESSELLVLDPQGRLEYAAAIVDDGDTAWLIADRADAAGLAAWLTRMRFRLRVVVSGPSEDHVVIAGTARAIGRIAVAAPSTVPLAWVDPWPGVSTGGWGYALAEPHPGLERDWVEAIVERSEAEEIARLAVSGEIPLAGLVAADALRIAAWRPRRTDADDRAIPHELDWLRTAVHLSKGCYRGQETVAKVHNLGHPPRRLVALQLDGSDSALPARGSAVRMGEDAVGEITSAAFHYQEGPIALALVRRSTPADATLTVETDDGPIAAAQETIVPPEAGKAANVPRMPRLSRRARAT